MFTNSKTVSLEILAQEDQQRSAFQVFLLVEKYKKYQYKQRRLEQQKQSNAKRREKRLEMKNPITTYIIKHIMVVVQDNPPVAYLFSAEEAMKLLQEKNMKTTLSNCIRCLKAAAAGLGNALKRQKCNCKVAFTGTGVAVKAAA